MKQASQDVLAAVIARDILRLKYNSNRVVIKYTSEFLDLFHEYSSNPKKITSYMIRNPGLSLS